MGNGGQRLESGSRYESQGEQRGSGVGTGKLGSGNWGNEDRNWGAGSISLGTGSGYWELVGENWGSGNWGLGVGTEKK